MAITSAINKLNFAKYRNIHKGIDGVIVATGPTLADYEPIPDAVHFGVNEAAMHTQVQLNYLFVQDIKPGYQFGYANCPYPYDHHSAVKFAGICPLIKTVESIPNLKAIEHNWIRYEIGEEGKCDWVKHCDQYALGDGQSVSFSAAQFALFTGVTRLMLVGMDIDSKRTIYDHPPLDANPYHIFKHAERWKHFGEWVKKEYPAVEILNVNPVGLKGVFEEYQP